MDRHDNRYDDEGGDLSTEALDSQLTLWTRIACTILTLGITLCGVSIYLMTEV